MNMECSSAYTIEQSLLYKMNCSVFEQYWGLIFYFRIGQIVEEIHEFTVHQANQAAPNEIPSRFVAFFLSGCEDGRQYIRTSMEGVGGAEDN